MTQEEDTLREVEVKVVAVVEEAGSQCSHLWYHPMWKGKREEISLAKGLHLRMTLG